MQHITATLKSKEHRIFSLLYLSILLLSFHYVFVVYINSSFVSSLTSEKAVGFFYILGALLNIIFFIHIPKILRKFGNWKTGLSLILLEASCLFVLALTRNPYIALPFFIIHQATAPLLLFNLDIFLTTTIRKENHVGEIRGVFLTINNLAYIIGPMIVGYFLVQNEFSKIYFLSFFLLVPLFFLIYTQFQNFEDAEYPIVSIRKTLAIYKNHPNLKNIFFANFILQFFYVWMVIYMPIYLHSHIGFSWEQIGEMFSIALLPFIFLQIPGGFLADKIKNGERDILLCGFIIMGIATFLLSQVSSGNFMTWTIALFLTRIGASLVEAMVEIYFFKHVHGKDDGAISFYRAASPLAYSVTPLIAGLSLAFLDYRSSFALLGLTILFFGLKFTRRIEVVK